MEDSVECQKCGDKMKSVKGSWTCPTCGFVDDE